jgi:hypothetical protein
VWVPTKPFDLVTGHSTITSTCVDDVEGGWWGRLGTDRLPADLDALPAMSDERIAAVVAWHDALYATAYALIRRAFPELNEVGARESMGEITTTGRERHSETRFLEA